jgi:hypothetical protein
MSSSRRPQQDFGIGSLRRLRDCESPERRQADKQGVEQLTPIPVIRERSETMRKVIEELDAEQRAALGEWADFGTAVFSSALAVGLLKSIVDLFT